MIRSIYSLLFYLLLPVVFIRVYWRALKEPRYRSDLNHRLGWGRADHTGAIWIHAVSAGETIASQPLVEAFLKGGFQVFITNMTPAGRDRVDAIFGERVSSAYVPYDLPHAVQRFVRLNQPKALVIIDTELWPNMIDAAQVSGVPVFLVNGRLSEKSARGYEKISSVSKPMLASITTVFAQTEDQSVRFRNLGAHNVVTSGSIKFDATRPSDFETRKAELESFFRGRGCLIAASTHEGEEAILVSAFQQLKRKDLILILAPRHTHRCDAVVQNLRSLGLKVQQHSEGKPLQADSDVYLVDTMGELIYFYGVAKVAFVGGSLVDVGGHNPMEPAALGIPILMGPHRRNIQDIAEQFENAGALITVTNVGDTTEALSLIDDADKQKRMRASAETVMAHNRGAVKRVTESILNTLNSD